MPEPRIVAAVGAAAVSRNPHLAKRIEHAMQAAILDGMAREVPLDSPEMKVLMMAARQAVKDAQ